MPTYDGLTSSEAQKLLNKYGPNALPESPPPSGFTIFLRQIKSPLVYILIVAAAITLFLKDYSDSAMIFAAVVINTVLGFIQEKRANDALYALKQMVNPHAHVIRNGELTTISVSEIVPRDTVVLGQGDKVPADGDLMYANRLFLQEAMLTGESAAIPKKVKDEVFMGTIVTSGRGYMKVTKTGSQTEMGKIAKSVQVEEEDTPMKIQLRKFSKQLSLLVLFLTIIVFIIGVLSGLEITEVFTTSVALAVSSIPEGLLVGLTVVLAIGMQRILKQKGLVRNLVSAETLGGVTTICVDKTGTLTQGQMKVVDNIGEKKDLAMQSILANDMDDPVVLAAYDWGKKQIKKDPHILINKYTRLDSLPFSSEERFSASLHKWSEKENMLFVNGAPEYILEWCDIPLSKKKDVKREIELLTQRGMRLVGMARKNVNSNREVVAKNDVKSKLEWVGILALSDPVRPGVKTALSKTQAAGIDVIVITGDYAQTARSVMHELGLDLKEEEIVLGVDLRKMSDAQLSAKLKQGKIKLFARTTPDQKLKIVNALKQNGEVVAMMGDGVNDAPALARSDIGIVVGEATDVAKESADLVLLNSSFSTIVSSIEEGRGIFDNVRKIILYLMCDAFGAIVVVLASIILGLPMAVTAAQILWVNLVADGFPNLALTVDPKEVGIMKRLPRSPQEPLINGQMRTLIAIVSLTGGILTFGLYLVTLQSFDVETARAVAFASLGINTLVYVFSIRTLSKSVWHDNPFSNIWLNIAVGAGMLLQLLPFISRRVGDFLEVSPLPINLWMLVISGSAIMLVIIELSKIGILKSKEVIIHGSKESK